MNGELAILAVLVGLGVWAARVLPTRFDASRLKPGGWLDAFLGATGPAAIATLLVAALLPMLASEPQRNLSVIAGLVAVTGLFLWRRNVILATFGGAAIHALAVFVLG